MGLEIRVPHLRQLRPLVHRLQQFRRLLHGILEHVFRLRLLDAVHVTLQRLRIVLFGMLWIGGSLAIEAIRQQDVHLGDVGIVR